MMALTGRSMAALCILGVAAALQAPRLQQRTALRTATISAPDTGIYSVGCEDTSASLTRLAARSDSWAATTMAERVTVAEAILDALREEDWGGAWLEAQVDLEGIVGADARRTSASQTRFVFGSTVKDMVASFVEAHGGDGQSERRTALLKGEAVAVGAAVPGATMEVRRGETPAQTGAAPGTVTLVLGAGNQSFLTLLDALQRALVDGETVLVKHHPLRPWLADPFAKILGPLVELDVVAQTLDAGVVEASALVADPRVGHVHVTGSEATRDAVRATLDAAGKAAVAISAELGCATPWLVPPGEWTAKELANAASALVAGKKANGGSNCLSPQVVLLADGWPQKDAFLDEVAAQIAAQPTWKAYYPGAAGRRDDVLQAYGRARLGDGNDDVALLDVGVAGAPGFDGSALSKEVFGPLLAVCALPGGAAAGPWLRDEAVPFANSDAVLGSLSCTLLAPASLEPAFVDAAVDGLNYGAVAVNCWSVFCYTAMCNGGTWGAHASDVGERSGAGAIGNVFGVPDAAKTVVRAGTLEKPGVDLAKPPPALVFDALHAALLKHEGSSALKAALNLLLRRGLGKVNVIPGLKGPKFGAALP